MNDKRMINIITHDLAFEFDSTRTFWKRLLGKFIF